MTKNLRKVIADVRKARYEGADKGEFVSGDVAPGQVRQPKRDKAAAPPEPKQ